jgi:hypothetical protein
VIENIWNNVDRDYNARVLVRRLQRIDKDMSGEARQQFAQYIEDGDMGASAASPAADQGGVRADPEAVAQSQVPRPTAGLHSLQAQLSSPMKLAITLLEWKFRLTMNT